MKLFATFFATLLYCRSVESFATPAGTTTCECNTCPCPTETPPPSPQVAMPSIAMNRVTTVRSTQSASSLSRSRPLSTSSKLRVGNSSPILVMERFDKIISENTRHRAGTTHDDDRAPLPFERELQNAARASTAAARAAADAPSSTDSVTPLSSATVEPSWKSALSSVALVSLGGVLAATVFIGAAPELVTVPAAAFKTALACLTPAAAVVRNDFLWTRLFRTGQFGTFFARPPPTALHPGLQRFYGYLHTKVLPVAIPTLKKMVVMELWRRIWSGTFRALRKTYHRIFHHPYADSMWKNYVPTFIRMGLKKMGIRAVQKRIEGAVEGVLEGVWDGVGDWWSSGGFSGEVDELVEEVDELMNKMGAVSS